MCQVFIQPRQTPTCDFRTFEKVAAVAREVAQDLAVLCVENIIQHRPTWQGTGRRTAHRRTVKRENVPSATKCTFPCLHIPCICERTAQVTSVASVERSSRDRG